MESINFAMAAMQAALLQMGIFLPRLLLALLIVAVGWLLATALRFAVMCALRWINFPVLSERARIDTFLRMSGRQTDSTALIGLLVFWLGIAIAFTFAFNSLGLIYATELLTRIALFVPRLILAVLVLVFGAYFAQVIGIAITRYSEERGLGEAELTGRLGRYAVLLFVVLAAFDQLEIGGEIIRQSFLIILAGVVATLALAFGLGGREWAASLIEQWWQPRQTARRRKDD